MSNYVAQLLSWVCNFIPFYSILISLFWQLTGRATQNRQKRKTTFKIIRWSPAIFTREYTQCTAGYTFCFVVVVGVVVVVGATFNQTWHYFSRQLIKLDSTWSDMIRNLIRHDQTWNQCEIFSVNSHFEFLSDMPGRRARQTCPADVPGRRSLQTCPADVPGRLAWQTCSADLPGKLAQKTCPADLPGRLARQTCPAVFPGSLAMTGKCSLAMTW
jgi:hypothetical protein